MVLHYLRAQEMVLDSGSTIKGSRNGDALFKGSRNGSPLFEGSRNYAAV
jgi:hypothetical protein